MSRPLATSVRRHEDSSGSDTRIPHSATSDPINKLDSGQGRASPALADFAATSRSPPASAPPARTWTPCSGWCSSAWTRCRRREGISRGSFPGLAGEGVACVTSIAGPALKACVRTTPRRGIRRPRREPYARARGLSAEEVARLLAAIPVESVAGLRLRTLILAYLLTGRRRSEVLSLRWRDLDLEGGFYRYTGKGGKERQRALPPPVRLAILVYARAAGLACKPEEAVFPGRWRDQPVDGKYIGEQLRQAARLAGIPLERPLHTLRHSYARALRRIEAPLEAVQAALDHSNLDLPEGETHRCNCAPRKVAMSFRVVACLTS
jgi:integrase